MMYVVMVIQVDIMLAPNNFTFDSGPKATHVNAAKAAAINVSVINNRHFLAVLSKLTLKFLMALKRSTQIAKIVCTRINTENTLAFKLTALCKQTLEGSIINKPHRMIRLMVISIMQESEKKVFGNDSFSVVL